MSQPPPPQPPVVPGGDAQPPAAPTQVGFPGQVQLVPQAQYAPTPQQFQSLQGGPLATGFRNYRSPAPSPKRLTGLIVGAVVVALTVVFAVVGFLVVAGRGANSPEGAVTQFVQNLSERDAEGTLSLVCEQAADEISVGELRAGFAFLPPGGVTVEVHGITNAVQDGLAGRNVNTTLTVAGQSQEANFFVVEDKGWRVCGGDGVGF